MDFSRRPGPALPSSSVRKDWKEVWEQAKGLTQRGVRARTSAKAPGQEHRWQVQAAAGRPAWLGRSPTGERQRVASEGREGQAKGALL